MNGNAPASVPIEGHEISNEEMQQAILALVNGGTASKAVEDALNAPASRLSSHLRKGRQRIALLLFHALSGDVISATKTYLTVHQAALATLAERMRDPEHVEAMSDKELLSVVRLCETWISPIASRALFGPINKEEDKTDPLAVLQALSNFATVASIHRNAPAQAPQQWPPVIIEDRDAQPDPDTATELHPSTEADSAEEERWPDHG